MFAALDQGYWPDGVYVPPSDEAMWQKWFIDKMATIRANALVGLGGAVYTQITDIDFEDTGILTFDRAFEKFTNISQLKYFSDKFYPSAFIPNIIIASGLKLFY
jgi:hypothetical protein